MRIHKLDNLVAQRIAAGEVIERPSSVVRELIDNSIDAGATSISLKVKEGGLEEITLIDNGGGINKEDLEICCLSHTTSKVSSIDDLYHLNSLGFRGEALYSIAAVSKLTISSCYKGEEPATIIVDNGIQSPVLPKGPNSGTIISVESLFEQIPARRQFLKRPSSEASLCKNVLIEKSLAFENIEFRYFNNDKLMLHYPSTSRKERVVETISSPKLKIFNSDALELTAVHDRFKIKAIACKPHIHRSDRSHIKIYINNRPISSYALQQAVSYGYGELLPGGSFPYCYVFIDIDPTLVDFNIHPAKREAKIRIQSDIHHAIVMMIKNQMVRDIPTFSTESYQEELPLESQQSNDENSWFGYEQKQSGHSYFQKNSQVSQVNEPLSSFDKPKSPLWFETAKKVLGDAERADEVIIEKDETACKMVKQEPTAFDYSNDIQFKYIGQIFNLFLIVEKEQQLYLIDQHAAHERILFDQIKLRQNIQKLLFPIDFEVERDIDNYLLENSDIYATLGITLIRKDDLLWSLSSIPTVYKNIENKIINYIKTNTGDLEAVETGLFAILACHVAIRQGDYVDDRTAKQIITEVFKMEEPCCPHGRTFVIRFEKEELMKAVGRT